MAEAENKKNEQPGTEPEEFMDETAEEIMDETVEEAMDEAVEEAVDETGAEDAVDETEAEGTSDPGNEEEPEPKAPAGSREKALSEKVAALEDKVKRQMAEFDNFRKRTSKEKEQMFSMGEKSVIEKMLPVVDNFERGLAAVPENEKQLIKQLEDLGVKPIEAVGKEFDPNFHNAVMQVESDEFETGVVAQEFQKGYTYHDMVIRHSMVGVVS